MPGAAGGGLGRGASPAWSPGPLPTFIPDRRHTPPPSERTLPYAGHGGIPQGVRRGPGPRVAQPPSGRRPRPGAPTGLPADEWLGEAGSHQVPRSAGSRAGGSHEPPPMWRPIWRLPPPSPRPPPRARRPGCRARLPPRRASPRPRPRRPLRRPPADGAHPWQRVAPRAGVEGAGGGIPVPAGLPSAVAAGRRAQGALGGAAGRVAAPARWRHANRWRRCGNGAETGGGPCIAPGTPHTPRTGAAQWLPPVKATEVGAGSGATSAGRG